ncbi:MAG: hypothetical protein MJ252_24035, partial [archaeon]|nr:hypothetical protein [archaeon]
MTEDNFFIIKSKQTENNLSKRALHNQSKSELNNKPKENRGTSSDTLDDNINSNNNEKTLFASKTNKSKLALDTITPENSYSFNIAKIRSLKRNKWNNKAKDLNNITDITKSSLTLPSIKLSQNSLVTYSNDNPITQREKEESILAKEFYFSKYNYVPGVLHLKEAGLQERALKICERYGIEFKNLAKIKNAQWLWKYYKNALNKLLENVESLDNFYEKTENKNKKFPLILDDMNE